VNYLDVVTVDLGSWKVTGGIGSRVQGRQFLFLLLLRPHARRPVMIMRGVVQEIRSDNRHSFGRFPIPGSVVITSDVMIPFVYWTLVVERRLPRPL
jgi:hypothetical protein